LEDRFAPATISVNSLADILNPAPGIVTLRSAIEQANATPGNNTVNLTVPGTYKITLPAAGVDNNATGDFDILPNAATPPGSTLTIRNTSGGKVVVDGNHLDRVFDINPANVTAPARFTVVLQGFTIQNGVAQPGDGAAGSGGGIRDQGNVSLTLTNITLTNNRATADGGGIAMENAASTPWTLTINNSRITNNRAGDAGGGVETDGSGRVLINPGTVITGNTSVNQGAGIWLDAIQVGDVFQGASLKVNGAVIGNNKALSAGGVGGGIGNAGNGPVTLLNSTLADNFAGATGGGFGDENAQGSLTVLNSTFLNNTATGNGGGIAAGGPVTSVTNTEIDGNTSGGTGGGLFANGVTLAVQSSTFANNTASGDGGGIDLETTGAGLFHGSTITVTTLTGNTALNNAGANGGGINAGANFTGDLLLLGDTLNANFASVGGGVFWAATTGSNFGLQNTIIAGNFAAVGPDAASDKAFIDLGGNLIGVSGPGSGNTGFTSATTQTGTLDNPLDPLLGPLQDNGGPAVGAPGHTIPLQPGQPMTLKTELLLSGSPAIGAGILPRAGVTDERGFPSVVDGAINVGATSSFSPAGRPTHGTHHGAAGHGSLNDPAFLIGQ
jgi:predicted outer membrane repeat protein